MDTSPMSLRRLVVAILALASLAGAGFLWLFTEHPETNQFVSVLIRVGTMLSALWLALPARGENFAWERALPILIGAALLLAIARRAFLWLAPLALLVLVAWLFLRPRPRPGAGRRSGR